VDGEGEKATEERDRGEINSHEDLSLRVTKLKGSVKDSQERWYVVIKLEALLC